MEENQNFNTQFSKKINDDPKLKNDVEQKVKELESKTGFKCTYALTEDEIVDTVYFMARSLATKFGCPSFLWNELVTLSGGDKNKVIDAVLMKLYIYDWNEASKLLMSEESEYFTSKQKLIFYIYLRMRENSMKE